MLQRLNQCYSRYSCKIRQRKAKRISGSILRSRRVRVKWFTVRRRNSRMTITVAIRLVPACCWLIFFATPAMSDAALDVLVAAYPDQLATHDDQDLVWNFEYRPEIIDLARKNWPRN